MPNQDWWLVFKTKKEGNAPKELSNDLKEVKKGLAGAVEGFTGMSIAGLGVAGVIAGVGAGLRASVGAAMEAETIQADLAATLKSTHGAAGLTADEINRMATEFSNLTGIEDDSIVKSQAMLLTFTNIGKDVFPDATEAVLNMSSKMGGLESASIQVGKALNDPIGGVSALRKVGVQLTDQQEKQIKTMVEMGNVSGAQKIILAELSTEFGGLAAAMGETTQGKINKAKNALGNLGESIGNLLLPALGKGAEILARFIKGIDDLVNREKILSDAALATASTYEDYIATQNKETGLVRQLVEENGKLYTVQVTTAGSVKKLYEGNDILSRTQFNVAQGMYDIQDEGTRMAAAMASGMQPAVEELQMSEAELKAEQDVLKKSLEQLKDVVAGDVGKAFTDYNTKHQELQLTISTTAQKIEALGKVKYKTQAQKDELDGLKSKLGEAQTAMGELDKAFEDSSKRMVFSMLTTKAASDGLTETEVANLTRIAENWGLLDSATANAAQAINKIDLSDAELQLSSIDDVLTHLNGLPRNYNYSITTNYSSTGNRESGNPGGGRFGGEQYASGGSFTIPPGYENHTWPVGPNKWAKSGEEVIIKPAGQSTKSGTPLIGTVIINNGMDQVAFERMLARAVR